MEITASTYPNVSQVLNQPKYQEYIKYPDFLEVFLEYGSGRDNKKKSLDRFLRSHKNKELPTITINGVERIDVELMKKAINDYKQSLNARNSIEYMKAFEGWLNTRGWEDDYFIPNSTTNTKKTITEDGKRRMEKVKESYSRWCGYKNSNDPQQRETWDSFMRMNQGLIDMETGEINMQADKWFY